MPPAFLTFWNRFFSFHNKKKPFLTVAFCQSISHYGCESGKNSKTPLQGPESGYNWAFLGQGSSKEDQGPAEHFRELSSPHPQEAVDPEDGPGGKHAQEVGRGDWAWGWHHKVLTMLYLENKQFFADFVLFFGFLNQIFHRTGQFGVRQLYFQIPTAVLSKNMVHCGRNKRRSQSPYSEEWRRLSYTVC